MSVWCMCVRCIDVAQELSQNPSIQVTLLEARDRIGGRIHTRRNLFKRVIPDAGATAAVATTSVPTEKTPCPDRDHQQHPQADIPIDFGASWVHGVDPSNPIMALADQAGVRLEPTNSDVIYGRQGKPPMPEAESNHYWAVLWNVFERAQDYARLNRDQIPIDASFQDWLNQFLATRQNIDPNQPNYMTPKEHRVVPRLAQFWAGENAIRLDKVSLKYMDAEIMPPGDHCMVVDGYDRLLEEILRDLENVPILFEHVVDGIEYTESGVKISTNKGVFSSDMVLVTVPLGVLKSNSIQFSPALPDRKQTAIRRLGFGAMVKVILHFPICFWPETMHFINFLPSRGPKSKLCRHLNKRQMVALQTYMKDLVDYTSLMPFHGEPILIAYATNESADAFEKLTEDEIKEVLLCQLAHYYKIVRRAPETVSPTAVYMTRWHADPFACGSYTSIPVGSQQSDLAEFEVPVGVRTTLVCESVEADQEWDEKTLSILPRSIQVSSKRKPNPSGANRGLHHAIKLYGHKALFGDKSKKSEYETFMAKNGVHSIRSDKNVDYDGPITLSCYTAILQCFGFRPWSWSWWTRSDKKPVKGQGKGSSLGDTEPRVLDNSNRKQGWKEAVEAVDDPERGRVHFAGEHTTPTSFASVHGAYTTGQREAAKMIAKASFM
ncbi:hypothetical protein BGW38_000485 [Lunasporangiospora selenospora]|uniref:Amine oxidase domain-containing protein n=1 Tax=Lunasporangiospora selenospora TaxID=979761 RepID=A0A9P6FUT1_9FUNG|nr:hypothetical protein BGW38_000485 [Lunasporangiospora selenospora]